VSGRQLAGVTPGLAYDCYGRELLVRDARTVELPDSSLAVDVATLLLAAVGAADPCSLNGTHDTALTWEPGAHPDVRVGVPLVRARRGEDSAWTLEPLSFATRPAARARVRRGTTPRGGTNWQPWTTNAGELFLGVETVVDTASSGFTGTPRYFVDVVGPMIPAPLAGALAQVEGFGPVVPLLHVADAGSAEFRARILLPLGFVPDESRDLIRIMYKHDVGLRWLGIEPHATSRCAGEST
jgi:hypothetical protein